MRVGLVESRLGFPFFIENKSNYFFAFCNWNTILYVEAIQKQNEVTLKRVN